VHCLRTRRPPLRRATRLLLLGLALLAAVCLYGPGSAVAAGSTTLTHTFPPGWSLISVPLAPANPDPAATFADLPSPLQVYARAGGLWSGAGEPDFTAVTPGHGYWLLLQGPATVRVTGSLASSDSPVRLPLSPGWNLVAPPWPGAVAWADERIAVSADSETLPLGQAVARGWIAPEVQGYDGAAGAYVPIPANGGPTAQLQPWQGYLLHSDVSAELIIAPPPVDRTPPTVSLSTPAEDAEVTGKVSVAGTAADANLAQYSLAYAEGDSGVYLPLATGTAPVVNGVLGTLDTAQVPNGIIRLRLTALDAAGNTASVGRTLLVAGQAKVGNFTVTFQDLSVPVSGIPITISRTYDSRTRATPGDFGSGWQLSVTSGSYTNNRKPGDGWNVTDSGGFFKIPCSTSSPTKPHITEIRFSDTEVYRFALVVNMHGYASTISGGCVGDASFRQTGGLPGASLEILGDNSVFWQNFTNYVTTLDENLGIIYEPTAVRLTTRDGRKVDLQLHGGVARIQDTNGNTLTFGATGVTHSSGPAVTFTRDSQGRITAVTDPMGQRIRYSYDAAGNLAAVTDRAGNTTTFTYAAGHLLQDILDPLSNRAIRSEYDGSGRLIATVDTSGNRREVADDPLTRQTLLTDRRGNSSVLTYDANGNILSKSDPLGNTSHFTYDSRGNALTETDPLGNAVTAAYDAQDNLLSTTDALGNTTAYTYNSRAQVLSIRNGRGQTTSNTYDAKGNLTTITDPLGNITRNTYDTKGNRTATTDGAGNTTRYEYDAAGHVTRSIDAAGHATTYTYNANGDKLSESTARTDASGASVTVTRQWQTDAAGRVTAETDPLGNITRTEYDALGHVAAVTDPAGNRTEYRYDAAGNLVRTLYPDGTAESATYDEENNRLTATDRAGRTTTYTYDAAGRLTRTLYPDGTAERREYDAAGRLRARIDENGNRTTNEYDALGRLTRTVDPLGNETRNTFDAAGNRTSEADANGSTVRHEYDAANRLTRTLYPDGTAMSFTYDGAGRKLTETDPSGNVTRFAYTPTGLLAKVTDALGGVTAYSYDELGSLVAQTDANGHTTRWAYDSLGRQISHTLPLSMTESFTYDANGYMLTHTDMGGQTTTFAYDVNNRLVSKRYPDGTGVSYTYTASGQTATVTDSRGVTRYTYDQRDRLLSVTNPDGSTIAYSYDAAGYRTAMTTSAGTTAYTYDAANRLLTVSDPEAGVTAHSYDRAGNQLSTLYPNGTRALRRYDGRNRLTGVQHVMPDGTVFFSQSYTLDASGNRVRVAENLGRSVAYVYDALSRLTEERITDPAAGNQTIRYTYDPAGNRLTRTDANGTDAYSYDANDRLLTAGPASYTWDRNGNALSRTDGAATVTFAYDPENRLTSAQGGGGTATYTYDPDGNLVRSTVNETSTDYLVDSNGDLAQVLEERGAGGALLARYIYGGERIGQVRGGAAAFYHQDGLGSTRALTDSSRALAATYTYDDFGRLLAATGAAANIYLFAGERYDPAAGLYYLRARYYDQAVGRFMTTDPFAGVPSDPMTLHRYLYARANPVNLVDPTGRFFGLAGVSMSFSLDISIDMGEAASAAAALARVAQVVTTLAKIAVVTCAASAVLTSFTALSGPCDVTKYTVLYPGLDTPQTTRHIADALALNPSWANLKRISPANSRAWLATDPRCVGRSGGMTGLWCDEYPFASSEQGGQGNGASLRLIPGWEQALQGGKLSAFYGLCNVKANDSVDGWFGVVPTGSPVTLWTCK
jgi:RHS repeat-associated protein